MILLESHPKPDMLHEALVIVPLPCIGTRTLESRWWAPTSSNSDPYSRMNVALDFDPDRFIDERLGIYLVPNPFIFLPFNAGKP